MKTRIVSLVIGCLFMAATSWAQDYTFRVMANKGANKANGQALMIGSKVKDGKIEIANDGYLGLAHSSGKTFELKQAGSYDVAKLDAKVKSSGNGSAASRYLNFVADELTQKNDSDAMARRYRHMSKTGSASRALPNENFTLFIFKPVEYESKDTENKKKNNSYIGDYAALQWMVYEESNNYSPEKVTGNYKVVVMDFSEKELFTIETSDMMVLIDLKDERLSGNSNFLFKVVDAKNGDIVSEKRPVKRMRGEQANELKAELAEMPQDETAIAALVRAKFFEDKGLLNDAMAAYTQAVMLAPQVETYQQMREEFMVRARMNMETEAEAAAEAAGEK